MKPVHYFSLLLAVTVHYACSFPNKGKHSSDASIPLSAADSTYDKVFVGYMDNAPVFDAYDRQLLFVYKDGKLNAVGNYPADYTCLLVRNEVRLFENKKKPGELIRMNDGEKTIIELSSPLTYNAYADDETFYYTDLANRLTIMCCKDDSMKKTGVSGYVIDVLDHYLFYSRSTEVDETPDVSIYELDLDNGTERLVAEHVSGEATVIHPNRSSIYDRKLIHGAFLPVIISVGTQKEKVPDVGSGFINAQPYVSASDGTLIFYNTLTLASKMVEW